MTAAKSSRSLVVNLIMVVAAFGLLGLAIASNWEKLKEVFANPIAWRPFALAFGLYLVALNLTFVRWRLLVGTLGIPFRLIDAVRLGFVGNIFNLVIPGAVGGDLIKAVFLARAHPERKASAAASMIIDRLLGLAGLFLLASVAGLFAFGRANDQARLLIGLTWFALLSGLTLLTVLFTPSFYPLLNRLAADRPKPKKVLEELERAATAYRGRISVIVACLIASSLIHSIFVVAFYLASRAIFDQLPTFGEHLLMVPLVLFTTAVPLPFGALGLTENASGLMFKLVGHPNGAVAMMAFRVLMYGSGVVSTLVYLANIRQIRDLTRAEATLNLHEEPTPVHA